MQIRGTQRWITLRSITFGRRKQTEGQARSKDSLHLALMPFINISLYAKLMKTSYDTSMVIVSYCLHSLFNLSLVSS